MEIDESLKARYGTRRPFTVPDGYFDQLADRMAQRQPDADEAVAPTVRAVRQSVWRQLSPLWVAASMVGLIVLVGLGVRRSAPSTVASATSQKPQVAVTTTRYVDDLDRLADYSMIDEDDVYAYLSSE